MENDPIIVTLSVFFHNSPQLIADRSAKITSYFVEESHSRGFATRTTRIIASPPSFFPLSSHRSINTDARPTRRQWNTVTLVSDQKASTFGGIQFSSPTVDELRFHSPLPFLLSFLSPFFSLYVSTKLETEINSATRNFVT